MVGSELGTFTSMANWYIEETITTSDKDEIEGLIAKADTFLASGNYTESEKARIRALQSELSEGLAATVQYTIDNKQKL